jgi:hypothetical protein
MATLPLQIIADVSVVTASPQVAAPKFNTGLIVGSSGVIPSYGPNSRVRTYLSSTYSTAMLSDGFSLTSPEYIAATIYFSQSPAPQQLCVGCQDLTAISAVTIGVAGTGYVVGDKVTITQSGASYGVLRVSSVIIGGIVTGVTLYTQGTGYTIANDLATTGGTGTGLEIDVTAIGESCLQAFQACRTASAVWYPGMVCGAVDADHLAISAWVLGQSGTIYFGNSSDTSVSNGIANNPFVQMFNLSSKRTWMQWSTTQSGLYPNQIYFTAAVMGQSMASNTQLTNSAFTEKFSGGVPLIGVVTEPTGPNGLSTSQISNIEGTSTASGPNGNLYLNYGSSFNVLEQSTMMAPGVFFDQILNLDILASNIQYAIMNAITSVPKVPQTDAGQQILIQAVQGALATSYNTGFIAQGTWNGQTILSLTPGTTLPNGYMVLSPSYKTWGAQNPGLVATRQAPPIYVALIEAGAVHFVTVEVLVQI